MLEAYGAVATAGNNARVAIRVESLKVSYGAKTVLEGVDLTVEQGSVHALVGRNGAGKSSFMRCLAGLQKPRQGTISALKHDVWRHRRHLAERVGFVPETPDAPPHLDAQALSRFCSGLYRQWNHNGLLARLERFGISSQTPFGALSRGQQTHVMLALALAHDPEMLLLDDPTLGLDAVARRALLEDLAVALAERDLTIVLTSHDLPGVERLATRVTHLSGGRLLFDDGLDSLKARFRRLHCGPPIAKEDLAPLEPLAIRKQGNDLEAIVGRFDAERLNEIRTRVGAARLETTAMSLEEIVVATAHPASAWTIDLSGALSS